MKRGATKEEIIRITQELITRNGIRAVRVDEIAQTLGISKRTLYEMFADKEDLVSACLDFMCHQQQERITAYRKRRSRSSLQRAFKLVYEYIEHLYTVESSFLSDLRHKVAYAEHFDEHREFWRNELAAHLRGRKAPVARNRCREFRRPDSGNDLRNADKQRDARGVLPLLQDDPARCGNPRRGRAD